MALVSLIPLEGNLVAEDSVGFHAPAGLQQIPGGFRPAVDSIRVSSIPSPLALSEATVRLVLRGTDHPLVEASELLLEGLTLGLFDFSWIALEDLQASALRAALERFVTPHLKRIGLITDQQGRTLGHVVCDRIPTIAGARLGQLGELRQLVADSAQDSRLVVALLNGLRESLVTDGKWSHEVPWMALIDRLVTKMGSHSMRLELSEDVRSWGPFEATLPGKERLSFYLLAHAPGYVLRLGRFLCARRIKPGEVGGAPDATLLKVEQTTVARFPELSGRSLPAIELGEGLAREVLPHAPANTPTLQELSRSTTLTESFGNHLLTIRKQCGSLTASLDERPWMLSDVARVVARYLPEMVDEASPLCFSPAFQVYAVKHGSGSIPPKTVLLELLQAGRAFILTPSPPMTQGTPTSSPASSPSAPQSSPGAASGSLAEQEAPSAVFIEDGVEHPEDERHLVGDLSTLGAGLWLAFTGMRHDPGFGYFDDDGDPLFDTEGAFPLLVSQQARAFWGTPQAKAASRLEASLQRFLRSYADPYPSNSNDLAALCALSARVFAERLLPKQTVEALLANQGGEIGVHLSNEEAIGVKNYGRFPVLRDSLRQSRRVDRG